MSSPVSVWKFPLFALILPMCVTAVMVSAVTGCSKKPEQSAATFLARGKTQLEKHDYKRAVLELKNAVKANPKSAEAHYQLALAYLGLGNTPTAIVHLRSALEADPGYTSAEVKLATLAAASPDPQEVKAAEEHLKRILAVSAGDPEAFDSLAVAEWRLGKAEEAEKLLSEAAARFPNDAQVPVALAKIRLARKDVSGAEAVLRSAVNSNPKSAALAVALGLFYTSNGRAQDGDREIQRALTIEPDNGQALLALAAARVREGRTDEADALYKRASALADPRYKPAHALFLYRSGKRDEAIAEMEKLAKQDLSDRDARSRLVAAYESASRHGDAERVLSEALKRNSKDVDALLQRSQLYVRDGKYSAASADLATILRFEPDSGIARYLVARVHQSTGAVSIARQELTDALRLQPDLLSARLDLADMLLTDINDPKAALQVLNQAPPKQKENVALLLKQNWAHLGARHWADARSGIDRALKIERSSEALAQDGALRLVQRNLAGARQSFDAALEKNPADTRVLNLLVQTYGAQNQMPAAVNRVRQTAARVPQSAPVQLFLGQLLLKTGNQDDARNAFERAKASNPGLIDADLALAQMDAGRGRTDDARNRIVGVIQQAPSRVDARMLLATVENIADHKPAAIEQYRKVIDLDSANAGALSNLAYLLAETGQNLDEALKCAQKAREIAPANPYVAGTLGWVLYRRGLSSMAVPYLEQAMAAQPTPLRKAQLAVVYFKVGQKRKGEDLLSAAVAGDASLARSEMLRDVLPASR